MNTCSAAVRGVFEYYYIVALLLVEYHYCTMNMIVYSVLISIGTLIWYTGTIIMVLDLVQCVGTTVCCTSMYHYQRTMIVFEY